MSPPEDGRVDLAPVELRRPGEPEQFLALKVHLRRLGKQRPVDVLGAPGRPRSARSRRDRSGRRTMCQGLHTTIAQDDGSGPPRSAGPDAPRASRDPRRTGTRPPAGRTHAGSQAPLPRAGVARDTTRPRPSPPQQSALVARAEQRLLIGPGEEQQRFVAFGEFVKGKLRTRSRRETPRLPHLETLERAQDHIRRRRTVLSRLGPSCASSPAPASGAQRAGPPGPALSSRRCTHPASACP